MARRSKGISKRELILILIAVVLVAALVAVLVFQYDITELIGAQRDGAQQRGKVASQTTVNYSFLSGNTTVAIPADFDTEHLMEVHFVDVGQGDAIVVRFPDGKDMIVDAGSGTSESATLRDGLMDYLEDIQIDSFDYMIATHAHSDHMNFLDNVLTTYVVKNIYYNGYETTPTAAYYGVFEDKAEEETDCNVVKFDDDGDKYTISGEGYSAEIYAPGYDRFAEDTNYMSPFIVLTYGGRKVLLTGDAETESESWFVSQVENLDIDVLKVGHHGSKISTSQAFIDAVKPEYAVISVGEENTYNHPNPFLMNRLFNNGIVTYRTNRHGNIALYVDNDGDFGFLCENPVPVENNKNNVAAKLLAA